MRFFWLRAESRIYDEAKQLVEQGLATADHERIGQRVRTIYSITPDGSSLMREWLATPPSATPLECEPVLRIFLADLCTTDQLCAALNQVKADADAILEVGHVLGSEYLEGKAPIQDQVHARALVFDFLWSHAAMLRAWAERTERMIDSWKRLISVDRAELARDLIQRNLSLDAVEVKQGRFDQPRDAAMEELRDEEAAAAANVEREERTLSKAVM